MSRANILVSVQLTPRQVAEGFASLTDEEQAQVFIDVSELAKQWGPSGAATMQWFKVGQHLKTCECSTYEARRMVQDIAEAIGD